MKTYINKAACGFILALASLLLYSSCTKEPLDPQAPVVSEGDGLDMTVHFTVPGTFQPDTRAFTEAQESDVNDLLLFAFKGGVLSYVRSAVTINNVAGNRKSFTATLKVSENAADTYKLMILANVDTSLYTILGDNFRGLNGKTYDELQKQLSHSDTTLIIGGRKWMPMWGETAEVEISGSKPIPSIGLLRSVARIDVGVNAAGFDANGVATSYQGLPDFAFGHLRFATWHYAASYIPSPSNLVGSGGSISVTAPTLAHSQTGNYRFYQGSRSSVHSSVRELYVMEHDVKQGEIKPGGTLHQNRAALIVAGNYKGTTGYYRIDFVDKSGNLINILRNNLYQINITEVSGVGYSTPEEAYMHPSVNMSAEVVTINDQSMTDVIYDGNTYLSVDKKALGFNSLNQALPVVDPAKPIMEHVVTVRTNSGSPLTLVGGDFEFDANDPTQTKSTAKEIVGGNLYRVCKADVKGINNGPGVESIYTITFSVTRYGGEGMGFPQWNPSFGLAIGKLRSPIEVVCDETKQSITITLVGGDNFALSGGGMIELDITSSLLWRATLSARGCFATFSDADVPDDATSWMPPTPHDKPTRIKVNFPRKILNPGTVDGFVDIKVVNGNPFIGEVSETIRLYQKRHTIWADGPITHTGVGNNAQLVIATDPNDGGVFFKPGSVIALSSGPGGVNFRKGGPSARDVRFTIDDIVFNPSKRTFDPRPLWIQWTDIPQLPVETPTPHITPESGVHSLVNIVDNALGDPCRLVGLTIDQIKGGNIDNKMWRLPTLHEILQDFSAAYPADLNVQWNEGAIFTAITSGQKINIVASGYRRPDSGNTFADQHNVLFFSSTPGWDNEFFGGAQGCTALGFEEVYGNQAISRLSLFRGYTSYALTARCVRQ